MAISLTAGMRSNLYNLQQTSKLMDQTAIRLNTGKKVNSALDDPISYFTSKDHMSRATDLGTLKNGMSEGIQTITAANNGIESIIALIAAAKSKAESAKSADFASTSITLETKLTNEVITIGGQAYTATNATGVSSSGYTFAAGDTAALTAASLEALVNSNAAFEASSSGAVITLSLATGDITAGTVDDGATNVTEGSLATTSEKAELGSQYNELLSQIDSLRDDSGYKGTNLLKSGDTLSVSFEGNNKLDVAGFDASWKDGLKISSVDWTGANGTSAKIDLDIGKLASATDTLESKASSLASSLSIVTVRQNFTENMINTLTTGADALTLADMNEEGANMLMLQTQQALGTSALSMSAQTAQGVLRLF